MESRKISEVARLKLQNINLSLQILQMQANQIIAERGRILQEELVKVECDQEEWKLNEVTWELERVEHNNRGGMPL